MRGVDIFRLSGGGGVGDLQNFLNAVSCFGPDRVPGERARWVPLSLLFVCGNSSSLPQDSVSSASETVLSKQYSARFLHGLNLSACSNRVQPYEILTRIRQKQLKAKTSREGNLLTLAKDGIEDVLAKVTTPLKRPRREKRRQEKDDQGRANHEVQTLNWNTRIFEVESA